MNREITTRSASRTLELGEKLGLLLNQGDVVALVGPLGVGKTVLAKGIGKGLGVKDEVLSPSFNIVLEYEGRIKFRHVDFYRLSGKKEADDMGMEEYLDDDVVAVVEWADRIPRALPEDHLRVEMEFADGDERKMTFSAKSKRFSELVRKLLKKKGT